MSRFNQLAHRAKKDPGSSYSSDVSDTTCHTNFDQFDDLLVIGIDFGTTLVFTNHIISGMVLQDH